MRAPGFTILALVGAIAASGCAGNGAIAPPYVPSRSDAALGAKVSAVFSIVDLGVPRGYTASDAFGINDNGTVVGSAHWATLRNDKYVAVKFQGGKIIEIGSPSGYSSANAINSKGDVTGVQGDAHGPYPVLWLANGQALKIPFIAGSDPQAYAQGLNDDDEVVGVGNPFFDNPQPFIYSHGKTEPLPFENGYYLGYASGINNAGAVAGFEGVTNPNTGGTTAWPAMYTRHGTFRIGETQTGANFMGSATAISNSGLVTGTVNYESTGSRGFLYDSNTGRFQPLSTCTGTGINNAGFIVTTECPTGAASLYYNGKAVPLRLLLPANSGFRSLYPRAINSSCTIVGTVYVIASHAQHAFEMIPPGRVCPQAL